MCGETIDNYCLSLGLFVFTPWVQVVQLVKVVLAEAVLMEVVLEAWFGVLCGSKVSEHSPATEGLLEEYLRPSVYY